LESSTAGAENWTHRKVDQKYLESFEMWYWRRMEKIGWNHHVRNKLLHKIKEKKNKAHIIKEG
jgi:hypothetical protein